MAIHLGSVSYMLYLSRLPLICFIQVKLNWVVKICYSFSSPRDLGLYLPLLLIPSSCVKPTKKNAFTLLKIASLVLCETQTSHCSRPRNEGTFLARNVPSFLFPVLDRK